MGETNHWAEKSEGEPPERGHATQPSPTPRQVSEFRVMAVTEVIALFWQASQRRGPEHGLSREMAMKKKLIPGAIVLLLASWFALDAVAAIILV
jgi:hypothetical protein